jgi:diguanylate cyclase (GGDEF)-like protein
MLRFLLLTGLYLLGMWYAVAFISTPDQVTLFWPPAGIAFAAVLRYGWRWSVFIPVAVIIAHFTFVPVPPQFIPFSVLANFLGPLAGAYAVHATGVQPRISVASGFGMLRGGMAMVLVSGCIGTTGLVYSGMVPQSAFWPSILTWGLGDLLGIITLGPTLLLVSAPSSDNPDRPRESDYSKVREKLLWLLLMLLSYAVVYWGGKKDTVYALGTVALPMSLLLWSALRFQPFWTTFGSALTVLFFTYLTGLGLAGFARPRTTLDTAMLLGFMSLFSIIPLVLVAALNEQRMATKKVVRRAMTDAATHLPNRAAFEEAVQKALLEGGPGALAYLDLDHFTLINDTASHAAGDALIHGIGSLLKARMREGDRVFRIGGDEFALLLGGEPEAIEPRLEALQRAIESYRVGYQDHVLNITVSIGQVNFRPGEIEYARLLSLADAACFTAKELGGNRIVSSSLDPSEMHERTRAMRWALRIREAIDRNLFELDCQSIVPLDGRRAHGRHFEVLLRMRDPETGERLAPYLFIPAAERFQLGVALDRHVVNLALHWLEERDAAAESVELCAINLTAASLVDEGFGNFLYQRVKHGRLPPRKLCFEVTETSAVRDLGRAQALIARMRSLGCSFSLDDFGTGFCSFNYLRSLDVDYFKIDGSFVRDLEVSSLSMAVIRSITDIAHVLDKKTIAEHTENESILAHLRELGVDFAQGFGIHRPEPIEAFFARQSAPAAQL